MAEFLYAISGLALVLMAVGLGRALRGPGDADRVMAVQLVGTIGIGALLLASVAAGEPAAIDLALLIALLAAFAAAAFTTDGGRTDEGNAR
jgi:multicomponent Na+:H+ antiporter subunit F